jgi:TolA-binding protein
MKQISRLVVAPLILVLVLVGCGKKATKPNLNLTPGAKAEQALCDVESKVLGIVKDVSSGTVNSQNDVASRLGSLKSDLDTSANEFEQHNQADLAGKVRDVSSAVAKLQDAVTSSNTAGIVTAAATIATAIQGLPVCPGVTPSP